jgi:hypothetical protein
MGMISRNGTLAGVYTRNGFLQGVLLGLLLVLVGWRLVPSASLLSVSGAGLILVVYGVAGFFGFSHLRAEILKLVGLFGLLAGAIFAGEIVLEYILLPKDNSSWGWVEFGSVFAIYFLTSSVAGYRCKDLRQGVLAAVGNAMFSSVIWLIFILLTFYIFRGSARQIQVFTAEGNYADFAQSGMHDFNTFVMEGFFGAGFYHLLLAPILAGILGTLGGLPGKGLARLRDKNVGHLESQI